MKQDDLRANAQTLKEGVVVGPDGSCLVSPGQLGWETIGIGLIGVELERIARFQHACRVMRVGCGQAVQLQRIQRRQIRHIARSKFQNQNHLVCTNPIVVATQNHGAAGSGLPVVKFFVTSNVGAGLDFARRATTVGREVVRDGIAPVCKGGAAELVDGEAQRVCQRREQDGINPPCAGKQRQLIARKQGLQGCEEHIFKINLKRKVGPKGKLAGPVHPECRGVEAKAEHLNVLRVFEKDARRRKWQGVEAFSDQTRGFLARQLCEQAAQVHAAARAAGRKKSGERQTQPGCWIRPGRTAFCCSAGGLGCDEARCWQARMVVGVVGTQLGSAEPVFLKHAELEAILAAIAGFAIGEARN